ncbi:MAG: RIP metalloprotease RseP [Opitutaceae bacterium]|jgi:regulator of sigma E protease|nr:RIP metalloprotease RseP [Opitutaceae bacterium]
MTFIQAILSNLWAVFLIILFFGGSIFVHELGHFLAARWRGLKVDRFSIGFGPKILGWRGRDGVEYRLSWIPLGGYVALPQLADMAAIEGEASVETEKLPPISYTSKVIVAVAGAVFNVLFAFALACIVWAAGQHVLVGEQTNRVGMVRETLNLGNGDTVPGPAFAAGIKADDAILAIDGKKVATLSDINDLVLTGAGRGKNGEPKAVLTLQRDGRVFDVDVYPVMVSIGIDDLRSIGIEPKMQVLVAGVMDGSPAEKAGLQPGDIITHVNAQAVQYGGFIRDTIARTKEAPITLAYTRNGQPGTLTLSPQKSSAPPYYQIGVSLEGVYAVNDKIAHIPPWIQIKSVFTTTWRILNALLNPRSSIGIKHMSGPVGIAAQIQEAARLGIVFVLGLMIYVNISLAVLNLLPIPVLDGGHILFATIAKLRGKPLPVRFVMTAQSICMVLLLSMILYVTTRDVRRKFFNTPRPPPQETPAGLPEK